jgi:hypothetical protein
MAEVKRNSTAATLPQIGTERHCSLFFPFTTRQHPARDMCGLKL